MTAAPDPAVLESEARRIATIRQVQDAVLAIFDVAGHGGGSGVVISPDGFALSNFHVVKPCGPAMKCGMADGRVYDAVVVGLDPTGDVAMIKLFGRDDFPAVPLGDSDALQVGDEVIALGNPFLLATDFQPTVTRGIVSGLRRYQYPSGTLLEYTDCIQTDASINPGNSGGPLFDAQGRLVGINGRASFDKRGRVNVGAAYTVSINQIKNFFGSLKSGRIVDHASLGATVGGAPGGVAVTDILETSDAYRRGLRYDDEIVRFAGRTVTTPNGLKNVLGILPAGWRVPLSYRRNGREHDIWVRLPRLHGEEELLQLMTGRLPELPMPPPQPPGQEPKGKKKTPGKPQLPRPPVPLPNPEPGKVERLQPPESMPEVVKRHFEEKRGFANYYFNRLEQKRLWQAWNGQCNLADQNGVWTLAGSLTGGEPFSLQLGNHGISLKLPSQETKWTPGDPLNADLRPEHSGGLFAALYLWRRLAVEGLARFGEVEYVGTAPWPGREGLVDVLAGSCQGVEGRFYFDPQQGQLLALEMFADENTDPCEMVFSQYRDFGGRRLPGRLEVRCGDEPFGTLTVTDYRFEEQGKGAEK